MDNCDSAFINCRLEGLPYTPLIECAALLVKDGRIHWVGPQQDCPEIPNECSVTDCDGQLLTPGLIDCHTHLVHGGQRFDEFEARLQGTSYEEIARRGGGILSTVNATRESSEDELYSSAASRLQEFIADGVTTMEIKSGYGLTLDSELKMLRVASLLSQKTGINIQRTFLGAHCIPEEYRHKNPEYIRLLCEEMLPRLRDHADACDIFCESIAFSLEETRTILQCAKNLGYKLKIHAEQLSNSGAAALAAEMGALSADHLEYLDARSVKAMAVHKTVAVLLPGAFYALRETQKPPVHLLRENHVPIAIASDCNPGSSPALSLTLMMNMACNIFELTPQEALRGVTINAARALGIDEEYGSLEVGKRADLALWKVHSSAELCGRIGGRSLRKSYIAGKLFHEN